jgi:hypothetical protein
MEEGFTPMGSAFRSNVPLVPFKVRMEPCGILL